MEKFVRVICRAFTFVTPECFNRGPSHACLDFRPPTNTFGGRLQLSGMTVLFIFIFSGCVSVQMPGYISRVDHAYGRKIDGSFEKVVSSAMYVLKKQGWVIDSEADPSIYERDARYDNNSYQNLLVITRVRKHLLHLTGAHLNVFIHSIGDSCDVEIRYEAKTALKFISTRNDRMVKGLLDAIEKDVKS